MQRTPKTDGTCHPRGIYIPNDVQLEWPYTTKTPNVALINLVFYPVSHLRHASVMNPVDALMPLHIPIKYV